MEKTTRYVKGTAPLPVSKPSNVVVGNFGRRQQPTHWIGGYADEGIVVIELGVTRLSPDATRSFARVLLTLADTADAQLRDE